MGPSRMDVCRHVQTCFLPVIPEEEAPDHGGPLSPHVPPTPYVVPRRRVPPAPPQCCTSPVKPCNPTSCTVPHRPISPCRQEDVEITTAELNELGPEFVREFLDSMSRQQRRPKRGHDEVSRDASDEEALSTPLTKRGRNEDLDVSGEDRSEHDEVGSEVSDEYPTFSPPLSPESLSGRVSGISYDPCPGEPQGGAYESPEACSTTKACGHQWIRKWRPNPDAMESVQQQLLEMHI